MMRCSASVHWAERVNAVPDPDLDDEESQALQRDVSDEEIAKLTFTICAIRSWMSA